MQSRVVAFVVFFNQLNNAASRSADDIAIGAAPVGGALRFFAFGTGLLPLGVGAG
jgi:hypothetical protein